MAFDVLSVTNIQTNLQMSVKCSFAIHSDEIHSLIRFQDVCDNLTVVTLIWQTAAFEEALCVSRCEMW